MKVYIDIKAPAPEYAINSMMTLKTAIATAGKFWGYWKKLDGTLVMEAESVKKAKEALKNACMSLNYEEHRSCDHNKDYSSISYDAATATIRRVGR